MAKQRVGIYGGTFNPIHLAHLAVARVAMDGLALDRLLFIPAGLPPLKGDHQLVDGEHRLAMVRLAIEGEPRFSVIDFEVRREQKSFTIDTVRHLVGEFPASAELYFVIGDDCAARLHLWKGIDELRGLVRFVCVNRTGANPDASAPTLQRVAMPTMPMSSTLLRERLQRGESVRELTPAVVADYIEKHRLYRAMSSATEIE